MNKGLLGVFGAVAVAASAAFGAFRPPAVPLVSIDTFFSVWSRADKLTDVETTHWCGAQQPMSAIVTIDGKPFRMMGKAPEDIPALPQISTEVRPTQSVCTFENEAVTAELVFSTPALPDDLEVFSRPVTYVTFRAKAKDGKAHAFTFSYSVSGSIASNDDNALAKAEPGQVPGMAAARMGRAEQKPLGYSGDQIRCDWGWFWLAAPTGKLSAGDTLKPARDQKLSLAIDLGSKTACETHLLLAYDDVQSLMYFNRVLQAWWRRSGLSFEKMLAAAEADYAPLMKKMDAFDAEMSADMKKVGGEKYAALAALSYRQSFAACKLVADPNGQPLYFSKENASNGCMGTVDLIYPQFPHLLLMSPTLARATLASILVYSSDPRWKNDFAPHDIGQYPLGNGQVYGDGERGDNNQMPVEETGNMMIDLCALSQIEGNADFAGHWWPTVTKWAKFLAAKGFDPENQLCTDDFAGHLAHNANLSIKAIMGIASYAKMAGMRGDKATADHYMALAKSLVPKWMEAAKGGSEGSYRLAFDKDGSWSMKYNLVWDRILGFNLFPASVAEAELAAYRKLQQPFGLPLDNRRMWTKADWLVWSATMTGKRDDFDALVDRLYKFADETADRIPFTDWYWADKGRFQGFIARSVIGGIFLPFLYDQGVWQKYAKRDKATTSLYAPLKAKPLTPTAAWIPESRSSESIQWKYTTEKPAAGWEKPGFDDSSWKTGPGGFGAGNPPGSVCRTPWDTPRLWVRRWAEAATEPPASACLLIHHDEDATVYLNGVEAGRYSGYSVQYVEGDISKAAQASLKKGRNLLAAEIRQTSGGQYLDFGVYANPAGEKGGTINAATFNVRSRGDKSPNTWEERAPRCVALVKAHGFDIFGLQEAEPVHIEAFLNGLPGWAYVGKGREKDLKGEFSCIFYKTTRFDLLDTDTFWLSEEPGVPGSKSWGTACTRVCTWAHLLDKTTGKDFFFFNTHLDHISALARRNGMAMILSRMMDIAQGRTVFLTGDLNSDSKNAAAVHRSLVKFNGPSLTADNSLDPIQLADVVLFDSMARSEKPHEGTENTFTGYQPTAEARIDYIFVSGNIKVLSHATLNDRTGGKFPSDHDPVMIQAELD